MKRILAAITALTLTLGAAAYLPGVQSAVPVITATAETYGDFEYTVNSNGTVVITKYTGSDKTVKIPSSIDGKKVTSIGSNAFYWCSEQLTEITIPDSVNSIEFSAFNGCSSLTEMTIPDGVTYIGDSTFEGCICLKKSISLTA